VRATQDVDAIVEVFSLFEYHSLERQLERSGFHHDMSRDAPVCRWLVAGAMLDVMPTDQAILGFGNRWYEEAVRTASPQMLPRGRNIRLISAPAFVATKLEAFAGRGGGDFLASHDLEDVITVVNGRVELAQEVGAASEDLCNYLATQFRALLENSRFIEALPGHLPGDTVNQARAREIVERLRRMAEFA
jgi:predicted nucleotidyltransferase